MSLNSIPWSRVVIDGRDTGRNTPVANLRIPAGTHTVIFRRPDGTERRQTFEVAAGETKTIIERF